MVHVTDFMPGLLVPNESRLSLNTGLFLFLISSYTLTIPNRKSMIYIRFLLAIPTILCFWDHAYGPYPAPQVQVDIGMALTGMYGIMRVIECVAVGIGGFEAPHWVELDGPEGKSTTLALPTSLGGRLAYAVDYLSSLRGTSWFPNLHWDFAPRLMVSYARSPPSRTEFLSRAFGNLFRLYILIDLSDTVCKSRTWDTTLAYPITGQSSLPVQLFYGLASTVGAYVSIQAQGIVIAICAVALGSHPSSWPPLFNSPFHATTLADLWTNRWHLSFRRNFNALANIIMACLPMKIDSRFTKRTFRMAIIFALSALLHLFLMYGPPIDELHPHKFFDLSAFVFFMSQPLGVVVEALVVVPLVQYLPLRWRVVVTRIWTWGFLLWTGRWWGDVCVRRGAWDPKEKQIGISVVRGLLWGKWIV